MAYNKYIKADECIAVLPQMPANYGCVVAYTEEGYTEIHLSVYQTTKTASLFKLETNGLIKTDKKNNMAYWDEIDDCVMQFIKDVSGYSTAHIKLVFDEDEIQDETTEEFCDLYGDGILCEIRDMVIEYLESKGAEFPFVDENY